MCGIAGFLNCANSSDQSALEATITQMTTALRHRGPDDEGFYVDANVGLALGHRRLAIIDLSPAGHQPMTSACGRYVIVFNGEIYNFQEIRQELARETHARITFRGHSDTEVMLAAFNQWGIERTLPRLNGMFAFAVWDNQRRCLHVARDRMGEKPLYYGWSGPTFLFASELKALRIHPAFTGTINPVVLSLYLRHQYLPGPYTIYENVYKLPPASWLTIPFQYGEQQILPILYWSLPQVIEAGQQQRFTGDSQEALEHFEGLLADAVKLRMEADVPLGAFLSGGIDSSTVVALMQRQTSQPVKTFTIGFREQAFNEADYARDVAHYLGTEHTELYVSADDALELIPQLPATYDEPFADISQIPTCLLAKLTRQYVTVSLSGDGGDELLGGYSRYMTVSDLWRKTRWIPLNVRQQIAHVLTRVRPDTWDRWVGKWSNLLQGTARRGHVGENLHKFADILTCHDVYHMYYLFISLLNHPEQILAFQTILPDLIAQIGIIPNLADVEWMMYLDSTTYLPDDLLVKTDRATMAVALEGRMPLLDHRLVECVWRLPLSMKIRKQQGKWLLRQVLQKYLPSNLFDRPKMGFGVPIGEWLRGPLRDWAEALLDEQRLKTEQFFDPHQIRIFWNEHLNGERDRAAVLWNVLMFEAWIDTQK